MCLWHRWGWPLEWGRQLSIGPKHGSIRRRRCVLNHVTILLWYTLHGGGNAKQFQIPIKLPQESGLCNYFRPSLNRQRQNMLSLSNELMNYQKVLKREGDKEEYVTSLHINIFIYMKFYAYIQFNSIQGLIKYTFAAVDGWLAI